MNERTNVLMDSLVSSPVLAIFLTVAAYLVGIWVFTRLGRPSWCPPVLVAAIVAAIALWGLSINYENYHQGASWLTLLLGPTTVALGVPLYQQKCHILKLWKALLLSLPVAAVLASAYAVLIAWLLGATPEVLASLAPKSVTAPIAIGIIDQLGGSLPLMMGGLLVTGVMATLITEPLARRMGIQDHRIIGFALGLNGHAIGTVRAFDLNPCAGAFASLGMSLTGVFTALLLPLVWSLSRLIG
ncbi:MAG: LrgB family protein [Halomonas sp.]|uniref:LrgB family protein n=1 Tax=Halomonas sp. TaxID=1486246 RepID=UPI003F93A3DE